MAETSRIPWQIDKHVAFLINTDDLQKTVLTPPSTLRYTLWGWSDDDSAAWTNFRTQAVSLYSLYTNNDKKTSTVTAELKKLITDVHKYDHDSTQGHFLLDRVALLGTTGDCNTFNIKRATALAKVPVKGEGSPSDMIPRTAIRESLKGLIVLDVDEPTMPDLKGRPKGVIAVVVCCFIGENPPKSTDDFHVAGVALRGRFDYKTESIELSGGVRLTAYFYSLYITSTGKLSQAGNVVSVAL